MKDIVIIFIVLIVIFAAIGFTPVCSGCDVFKIELKDLPRIEPHMNYTGRRHDNKHKHPGSCENCTGECEEEGECDGSCEQEPLFSGHCREEAKGVCGNDMNTQNNQKKLITISQIREDASSYDSRQVYLIVSEGIRPGDAGSGLEQLSTRSDCYVHDDTGTMVLRNGWQYKNAYVQGVKSDKDFVLLDDNIKIEKGKWYIEPFVYSRYSKTILSLRKFD